MNYDETPSAIFLSSLRPPPPPAPTPPINLGGHQNGRVSLNWLSTGEQILNFINENGYIKWDDRHQGPLIGIKWEMDKLVIQNVLIRQFIKEKEGFFPWSKKEYIYKNKIQHQREEKLNQILK